MQRSYHHIISHHLADYDQMALIAGPRQVGKTTLAKTLLNKRDHHLYLNWDNIDHRETLLAGIKAITASLPIDHALSQKPIILFDEIHKFHDWKNFLKGIADEYKAIIDIIVTGSAKLNVFRRGGDSMMGRYFLYRMHPFSIGELLHNTPPKNLTYLPSSIDSESFDALMKFGGFPEPLSKQSTGFSYRWQRLRAEQMIQEDIRNTTHIQEFYQLELLANLLKNQTSQLLNYSNIAKKVRTSDQTIRRWLTLLESSYYCFTLKPWTQNITRSLLKMPKLYLWDWSVINDPGARSENIIASHLLKSVHGWNDMGKGNFSLYFVRDKDQKEVDFLVTKNEKPWLLLEVKQSSKERLSPNLQYFQDQLHAEHVLQIAMDAPYVEIDCFSLKTPKIVPAKTFLSQLL